MDGEGKKENDEVREVSSNGSSGAVLASESAIVSDVSGECARDESLPVSVCNAPSALMTFSQQFQARLFQSETTFLPQ